MTGSPFKGSVSLQQSLPNTPRQGQNPKHFQGPGGPIVTCEAAAELGVGGRETNARHDRPSSRPMTVVRDIVKAKTAR